MGSERRHPSANRDDRHAQDRSDKENRRTDVLHKAALLHLANHLLGGVGQNDRHVFLPVLPHIFEPV